MNKSLYDKSVEFPKDKREHIKKCFQRVPNATDEIDGFKRNKELQNQEFVTYKQLKRIKNFFDNFKGNQNEPSYILNGGVIMRNWVNDQLRQMRDSIENTKRNKMETGMDNQFIKPHEKTFMNVRPSQKHKNTLQKYDTAVTESLRRINEIMSKL